MMKLHIHNTLISNLTQCGRSVNVEMRSVPLALIMEYWKYLKRDHLCKSCRKKSPSLDRLEQGTPS